MDSHVNVGHWDDVAPRMIDRGDLHGERTRLGPAVGTAGIGCSRYRLEPGRRAMPVHVHADEEELFYVLAGSGLSWQDGRSHRVRAGDLVCHRPGAEAHTFFAGPDGIDVLAFGSGSTTNMTWLPRAGAWWMGPRWLPADGPNPFVLEAAAGPLEPGAPEPLAARPATIVSLADVEAEPFAHGRYQGLDTDLGRAAGSVGCGLRHDVLPAGAASCPPHWHTAEEELFVVLAGAGEVELGTARVPIGTGSLIARPPATSVEHVLHAGVDGLTYLAFGTRVPHDVVHYPRTGKLLIGKGTCLRVVPADYWDDEG